jgi:thiosulfate/3-mercaptopyruvate sulfurtransferase
MSAYAHPAILVDTQWVAEHLNDPKFRIIEIGYDYNNYTSDHIPGAVGWA